MELTAASPSLFESGAARPALLALQRRQIIRGIGRSLPRNDMLCDACQEREATVHTTNILGDVLTHSNLCESCFEGSKPTDATRLAAAQQAGCRYCGGEPYIGGGHSLGGAPVPSSLSFMCKLCAEEYFRFLRQELPGFGEAEVTTEQIAEFRTHNMAAVLKEADEHMKKWVPRRSS